jgi:hypothetical protein
MLPWADRCRRIEVDAEVATSRAEQGEDSLTFVLAGSPDLLAHGHGFGRASPLGGRLRRVLPDGRRRLVQAPEVNRFHEWVGHGRSQSAGSRLIGIVARVPTPCTS